MISISVDLSGVRERLRGFERDIPFLAAYALTKSAQDVKAAEVESMRQVFDRPTPYTLNALRVKPATKQDLTAIIDFKEFGGTPAWKYLGPQIMGGPRRLKRHERALIAAGVMRAGEYAVPGQGVTLDAYGNMPGALIKRILSALSASSDAFQNVTARSKRRARKRAGGVYVVMRGRPGIADGIYVRLGAREIKPMIVFVRAPTYHARLPFYDTAREVVRRNVERHFWEGVRRYVGTRALPTAPVAA
jgi:hypothetical protein